MRSVVWLMLLAGLCGPGGEGAACTWADECVSDISQADCPPKYYLTLNKGIGNCCPLCELYYGLGELCTASRKCAPGLKCVERECVLNLDSCLHVQHLASDKKPIYPPTCNPDGTYAAVQCKGDSLVGRCFCSNTKGKRIFGISWANKKKEMTCACSRRRADLEMAGRTDVTFHCASNGNYEELQCDSGQCWCADTKTGEPKTIVVSEDLVSQLACYEPDTYGSQYMRLCESKQIAIAKLKIELALHGTTQVTMMAVNCDYDGTYGVYQIENGIAYCSTRDGKRLGSWQTEAGANLALVDCNCARDTMYFAEADMAMSQTCTGNGNYLKQQQLNGQLYCVDSDGFATTDLKPLGVPLDCGQWG